jgi:uncharacterized coiled-coil DUF342 family protein
MNKRLESFTGLLTVVQNTTERAHTRINKLTGRVVDLEQQGSEHDQHIGKLVKKVCALDDRVDWIHSKIHKHNKYLQQHKEHIGQLTQDMR